MRSDSLTPVWREEGGVQTRIGLIVFGTCPRSSSGCASQDLRWQLRNGGTTVT